MAPKGGTEVEKNKVAEKADENKKDEKVDESIPEEADLSEEDQALK